MVWRRSQGQSCPVLHPLLHNRGAMWHHFIGPCGTFQHVHLTLCTTDVTLPQISTQLPLYYHITCPYYHMLFCCAATSPTRTAMQLPRGMIPCCHVIKWVPQLLTRLPCVSLSCCHVSKWVPQLLTALPNGSMWEFHVAPCGPHLTYFLPISPKFQSAISSSYEVHLRNRTYYQI